MKFATVLIAAVLAAVFMVSGSPSPARADGLPAGAVFVPVTQFRLFDTRDNQGAKVKADTSFSVTVPEDAVAVVMNLTYLDADGLALTIEGAGEFKVTPLEARLLQLLIAQAGQVVPTERLLVHVWGHRAGGDRQLLKQLVHRLRQKICEDPESPRWLETVPGAGYRLRP